MVERLDLLGLCPSGRCRIRFDELGSSEISIPGR